MVSPGVLAAESRDNFLPDRSRNVEAVVEADNVFTLELGVPTGAGLVGLEEDVLVTAAGREFLSSRQRDLMLI